MAIYALKSVSADEVSASQCLLSMNRVIQCQDNLAQPQKILKNCSMMADFLNCQYLFFDNGCSVGYDPQTYINRFAIFVQRASNDSCPGMSHLREEDYSVQGLNCTIDEYYAARVGLVHCYIRNFIDYIWRGCSSFDDFVGRCNLCR